MKVLRNLSTVLVGMMLAACSTDTREEKPTGPDSPGGDGQEAPRQEVQVTFQNRLSVGTTPQPAGNKDANASTTTEATGTQPVENRVTSLDMYVFGSTTEDGVYTFRERFAYREDPAALPEGATELKLENAEGDGTKTTALLSLKKGLFVRLYCIVNQPTLVNPADETKPVGDADFKSLELAEPGKAGSAVKTAGTPELTAFETFHTPLIDPASANDTLACPLPMSGSAGKALDLTDYAATARVQASIELTRLVARFDISNNSELSRFTIESVSISNGRKGAAFFPIRVYGTLPDAADGDLVTYPERKFHGARANLGIQTSAFYCYPSLLSDGAQLVLKGKYRKSETESVDVSYPVRFASKSDDTGTPLAVNPDRRYALVITGAGPEHLDFVLQEFDWSDSGELDDYDPQANPDEVNVTVPEDFQADTQWNPEERTVIMSPKEGSQFAVTVTGSDPALVVAKTYAGDNADYDWLAISEPVVSPQTKALPAFGYTYTFSLRENYTAGRYPKATIRFIDSASGRENEFSVTITALAVQSTNIDLKAAGNETATNRITACPLGYEAEVTWKNGGAEWFDITTPNPSTSTGAQDIALKVKSGLSNDAVINTARITLKNKITDGGDISFTVAPVWQAPTLETASGSMGIETVSVLAKAYGGIRATSSNTSIATVEVVTGSGENIGKDYIRITGVAEGSAEITVKNKQDESKTTSYTITVNPNYVTINGLKWAVGNLVMADATHCKIGAPTDGGLYFRFGSLVGYDDSEPDGNPAAVVTPSEYTGGKPVFTDSPYTTSENISENTANGLGDPCKYYLKGTWRLPTEAEYRSSLGGNVTGSEKFKNFQWTASYEDSSVPGGILNNTAAGPGIFFPISGQRSNTGQFWDKDVNGYIWTSTGTNDERAASRIRIGSDGASASLEYKTIGFNVRCVKE